MSKEVEAFYDKAALGYDTGYSRPVDLIEDRLTATILRRHINHDSFVLDVGCGTGLLLSLLDEQPDMYVGTDISEGMLNVAVQQWGEDSSARQFHKLDMMGTPWESNEFDVVTCLNSVAMYATDLHGLISRLRGACRDVCLLSVPLPRHKDRPAYTAQSPNKTYRPLDEYVATVLQYFEDVQVTTYSSAVHDRLPLSVLAHTGVMCPAWMAYYALIEARVT